MNKIHTKLQLSVTCIYHIFEINMNLKLIRKDYCLYRKHEIMWYLSLFINCVNVYSIHFHHVH